MNMYNNSREALSVIWVNSLDNSTETRVEDHDKFFDCGGESMAAIRMYLEIEERLGAKMAPEEFLGVLAEGDFGDLVRLVDAATQR